MSYIYWIHKKEHTDYFTEGYIGVCNDLKERLHRHKYLSKKNKHVNPHLSSALKLYETICTTILEGSEDYCYEVEAKLRPSKGIGWNIAPGGEKPPGFEGLSHTEEHKKKMSELKKGIPRPKEIMENLRQSNIGREFSSEHREKLSEAGKNRIISEETREKLKLINLGREFSPEHKENIRLSKLGVKQSEETINKRIIKNTGKKRTQETKERIRQANTGKQHSEETKDKMKIINSGSNNPFFGKQHSEETKEKIRQAKYHRDMEKKNMLS